MKQSWEALSSTMETLVILAKASWLEDPAPSYI